MQGLIPRARSYNLGVSSGSKLFAYGTSVVLGGLRVNTFGDSAINLLPLVPSIFFYLFN